MLRYIFAALLLPSLAMAATAPSCVGGVAVSNLKIMVQPGGKVALPLRKVNNLLSSYRISYQPIDLPADLKKDARLTLVAVPNKADGQITVLDPRPASAPQEWRVPDTPHVLLVVYRPNGLDEKRLTNLVTKDEALVAALADYADQTADLEAGLEAANDLDDFNDDDTARPARPLTPAEQAIFALVRSLNPGASDYNPLGVGRRAGSATTFGKGAETFFDNAGGIFPGSGALPIMKTWLMPDMEFRSVYVIPKDADGITFCAQVAPKTRNRAAARRASFVRKIPLDLPDVRKPDSMRVDVNTNNLNPGPCLRQLDRADAKPGELVALTGPVQGMAAAVRFPGALQVAAARPRIREAKPSTPQDQPVTIRNLEVPAGSWTSYALAVEPADATGSLTLACADGSPSAAPVTLHLGEKQANAQLTGAGSGTWFLSLDPGSVGPAGCALTAVVETTAGKSDVFALGKVVRLPRIEAFAMTDEKSPDGYFGVLKGFDLESIGMTAWAPASGVAVTELPRPIPGEGSRQTLRISMPWPSPSPKAPLFIWLRGETDARATKITP